MPEVFVSNRAMAPVVSRAVQRGSLRKIASRLYTRNLNDLPESIVRRNVWPLVASYVPRALISDRTALENRPASDGSVFLVSEHNRNIVLPGLILRSRKGPAPLASDRSFISDLRIASTARAFLENMRPSRARQGIARTLTKAELEERLDEIVRLGGEAALQKIRTDARSISQELAMAAEFRALDRFIGALLGSRKAALESPVAIARAAGMPYDPHRLDLFQRLHSELASTAPVTRPAKPADGPALPFFESYFSNFIEGTEFAVNEAADIIFRGHIPKARPEDAHDVLGTWKVASDEKEMSRLPRNFQELQTLLKSRHAVVMEGRPAKAPDAFKSEPNRAGSTVFVAPELVDGTLAKGFELYRALAVPLHRAIFMMALVAEVHPFSDGNGRTARLMMNAELVAAGECRIIVPAVYRNNYLAALKAFSHNASPGPLLRVMDFAHRYTVSVDFSRIERARLILDGTHAFADPDEADAAGIRLTMPTPEMLEDAAQSFE